jgi:hypothetical protein
VLLTQDGTPKVTDFGLAKKLDEAGQTQSGAILGTPSYMAPEQAEGNTRTVGKEADIYSLGAILYDCLAGRPPFRGDTVMSTVQQVLHEEPVPPTRLVRSTPRDLEAVCLKCLEKKPEKRYRTAGALAEDLARFRRGEPVLAKKRTIITKAISAVRRRLKTLGFVAVVLLALVGAVFLIGTFRTPAPVSPRPDPNTESENDGTLKGREEDILRQVVSLKRQLPLRLDKHPASFTEVEQVSKPDNSSFEVIEDARVWDLRGWQPSPGIPQGALLSAATMSTRMRLQKLRPARDFVLEARTTGSDVFLQCLSHPDNYRILAPRALDHVGTQQTKVRQCVVNVSDVPLLKEFDLKFVSTYWSSFQKGEDRWLGIIGYKNSFKVSMLILFPEDRPFKTYRLTVAPTAKGAETPFEGRKILLAGQQSTYLYWEIPRPEAGKVYRVRWDW